MLATAGDDADIRTLGPGRPLRSRAGSDNGIDEFPEVGSTAVGWVKPTGVKPLRTDEAARVDRLNPDVQGFLATPTIPRPSPLDEAEGYQPLEAQVDHPDEGRPELLPSRTG